VPNNLYMSH